MVVGASAGGVHSECSFESDWLGGHGFGRVEIQAQHWLQKPRTGSVGTDRLGWFCAENRDDTRKDIPRGIYFGVSVGALNEH